jgi:hypothetical protein
VSKPPPTPETATARALNVAACDALRILAPEEVSVWPFEMLVALDRLLPLCDTIEAQAAEIINLKRALKWSEPHDH